MRHDFYIFSGSSNRPLAQKIAKNLKTSLGKISLKQFSDGEYYVNIEEKIRNKKVILIQSCATSANDNLMELLLMTDAAKRLHPKSITTVLPFYPYRRQDHKVEPGESISAELVAKLIKTSGSSSLFTVNLHTTTIEPFIKLPFFHLRTWPIYISRLKRDIRNLSNYVVVAPDEGAIRRAKTIAQGLGITLAVLAKERPGHERVKTKSLSGDVSGKNIIIVDDEISTGTTAINCAKEIKRRGAKKIIMIAAHAVLSSRAPKNLTNSPIDEFYFSDTIKIPEEKMRYKFKILSAAPLISDALKDFAKL